MLGGWAGEDDGKVDILFFLLAMSSFLKVKETKERKNEGKKGGKRLLFSLVFCF